MREYCSWWFGLCFGFLVLFFWFHWFVVLAIGWHKFVAVLGSLVLVSFGGWLV